MAFADDVVVFTQNDNDSLALLSIVIEFEGVSNSKLNMDKSKIYDFNDHEADARHHILRYPLQNYETADFKYLGFPNKQIEWNRETHKVIHILKQLTITSFDLVQRALAINSYIFSKLPFRDLHSPMTKADVKYFTHQLLPFFTPHKISLSNLIKPRSFGGFGLIDPYEQLKGRQAKFIFHILTNSENPHYVLFRHKLQMFTNMTCHGFCYSTEQNTVRTVPWYTALLGYKDPLTNAVTRLDSDITNHLVFKSDICQVLSDVDRTYLDSWFDVIHYQVKHYETTHIPHNYSLRDYQQMVSSICPNTENIIDLQPTLFKSRSKKIQHEYWTKHTSRLIPETISNLTNTHLSDWYPFWSFLKSHFLSTKIHTDHIQLFHLGIGLWKFYQEQRCTFCSSSLADLQPNVSSNIQPSAIATILITHIYLHCDSTQHIWLDLHLRHNTLPTHRQWPLFITPRSYTDNQTTIINRYHFILGQINLYRRSQWQDENSLPALSAQAAKNLVSFYLSRNNI